MTLKDINFSIAMYGTTPISQSTYEVGYTGDESSINVKFTVTDEADLAGATAKLHLYFADSSHIVRDMTLTGLVFNYTLVGTENDHAGVVRADIIITKSGAKYTRAGHRFRIDTSLEASAPLVEYAIDTLDTLVDGAEEWLLQAQTDFGTAQSQRADEWVADNDTRSDEFTAAQTSRAETFTASEADRTSTFNTNETGRSNTFTTNENARQAAADSGELARDASYMDAEANRDSQFTATEAIRSDQEAGRVSAESARVTAEAARVTEYKTLADDLAATLAAADANIEEFDIALQNGIVATNIAAELQNLEATYAPDLVAVKQQLEQALNKSAITLTHMFADNTARDAYFVANQTELMEQLFIKVGSGYQQYLEGEWQASAAIVAEQLSATNQPIIDTGNYFATDNTNEALQELGAHKASTANPHGVTKAQVGLGNVDNTSDANKPISTATQTALNLKVSSVNDVLPDENGNVTIEAGGDKLVATVTYNSNVELTPTALDIATGTFTIPNHGLTANTKIAPNFNANNGFPAILGVYPGGMTQEQYFVIVVDADNIKLSKTSGGAPITITSAGIQSKWHFEKWNVGSVNISGLPPKNKYRVVVKGNVLWAGNSRIVPLTPNWYTSDWNSNWYPLLTPNAPGYWYIDVQFEVLPVNKIIGTAFNIKPNTTLINTLTNIDIKYIRAAHNAAQITAVSAQFSEFIGNGMIVEVYDIEQSV